jgi:hypothetical protein
MFIRHILSLPTSFMEEIGGQGKRESLKKKNHAKSTN